MYTAAREIDSRWEFCCVNWTLNPVCSADNEKGSGGRWDASEDGKEGSGGRTCVYLWLIHVDVWQSQDDTVKQLSSNLKHNNKNKDLNRLKLSSCISCMNVNTKGLL